MRRTLVKFPLTPDDMNRLFASSNELTIDSWDDIWLENIQLNLKRYPQPTPASKLITGPNYHTVLVCGAGCSLRKLKAHAHLIPPSWGIVCVDRSLWYVLECGLEPSLVVTMDGNQREETYIQEGFRRLWWGYPHVPTLVDLVCCPTITHQLRRPHFFRSMTDERARAMKYLRTYCEEHPEVKLDQIGHGGNVGSVATIVAKYFLYARHVVLLGLQFSFAEGTSNISGWDRQVVPDVHTFVNVSDIYGRPLRTMANLHNYRTWQEYFCSTNEDVEWVNANDGGYLGVHDPHSNYDHFTYETLPQAIKRLGEHGLEDH